jgi:putative flippase GtrA
VKALVRPFASGQFLVFLLVGGTAAVLNFSAGALVRAYSASYPAFVASVTLGFVLGTLVSFVLNRHVTFRASAEAVAPQAFRFGVVALGSVVISVVVASAVLWAWELAGRVVLMRAQVETVGHLGAIGVSTVYNFLAMKFFAFRSARAASEPARGTGRDFGAGPG